MKKVRITKLPKAKSGGSGYGFSQGYEAYNPNKLNAPKPSVRDVLGPVDKDVSNIEAELGETVFMPNIDGLSAHYTVGGNRHSEGGTPLLVPPKSFIFSDTRKMTIKDEEILNNFGESKSKTPAKIAKKYDINYFRKILADPSIDKIQRETAEFMISGEGKYEQKLAKLALVQESMKGFPNGIPEAALPYLAANAIEPEAVLPLQSKGSMFRSEQEQSMNNGRGYAQTGGGLFDKYKPEVNSAPSIYDMTLPARAEDLPVNINSDPLKLKKANTKGKLPSITSGKTGVDLWDKNYNTEWIPLVKKSLSEPGRAEKIEKALRNYTKEGPEVQAEINRRLDTGQSPEQVFSVIEEEGTDSNVGPFHRALLNAIGVTENKPSVITNINKAEDEPVGDILPGEGLNIGEPDYTGSAPWWIQDQINVLGALGDRASLKKYLPWAPKVDPVLPNPTFYDPTREIAANAEQANIAQQAMSTFSGPQSASARSSSIQGSAAKNVADIMSKYNNLNVGTANQFATSRAATLNQYSLANAAIATDLYDKTVTANQNFDNAKREANAEIRTHYTNAITNRAKAQVLNELYPQWHVDPSTGGMIYGIPGPDIKPTSIDNDPVVNRALELRRHFPDMRADDLALLVKLTNSTKKEPNEEYLQSLLGLMGI